MARAAARHILVDTQEKCEEIKKDIAGGADFADMARQHSSCPSGKDGGTLGEFSPGQMVKEFDEVVFRDDVGVVHGPVKTQFGYHLIEITTYFKQQGRVSEVQQLLVTYLYQLGRDDRIQESAAEGQEGERLLDAYHQGPLGKLKTVEFASSERASRVISAKAVR